jgi:hypothetical protein
MGGQVVSWKGIYSGRNDAWGRYKESRAEHLSKQVRTKECTLDNCQEYRI